MLISLQTDICVTQPQWLKVSNTFDVVWLPENSLTLNDIYQYTATSSQFSDLWNCLLICYLGISQFLCYGVRMLFRVPELFVSLTCWSMCFQVSVVGSQWMITVTPNPIMHCGLTDQTLRNSLIGLLLKWILKLIQGWFKYILNIYQSQGTFIHMLFLKCTSMVAIRFTTDQMVSLPYTVK